LTEELRCFSLGPGNAGVPQYVQQRVAEDGVCVAALLLHLLECLQKHKKENSTL
jgi:hypothetical protein